VSDNEQDQDGDGTTPARLLTVRRLPPEQAARAAVTSTRTSGQGEGSAGPAVPTGIPAIAQRAERLIEWAAEESRYLRANDVATFSAADRHGRQGFADEALYELLPAVRTDTARLRVLCGRGPLTDGLAELVKRAGYAVQAYCALWAQLRAAAERPTVVVLAPPAPRVIVIPDRLPERASA